MLTINFITGALVVSDKVLAKTGLRRIPESSFHLLSLIGGWYGGYLGFLISNHKLKKFNFMAMYTACCFLNSITLYSLDAFTGRKKS